MRKTMNRGLAAVCLAAGLGLAAFGPARNARAAEPPLPVQTVEKSVARAELDKEKRVFLNTINQYRRRLGLPQLAEDPKLAAAAQWLSQDMADHDYLGHEDSKGRGPFERMDDFGYFRNTYKAENVAAGQETAAEVFQTWKQSKPHDANMRHPKFKAIGIGLAFKSGTTYGWYWTTTLGGQVTVEGKEPARE